MATVTSQPVVSRPTSPTSPTHRKLPSLIVVGNGMVSYSLCDKLISRQAQRRFRVTVFGEEPRPAYDRVNLTKYLQTNDANRLELASRDWYSQHAIDLHLGQRVEFISREHRTVYSDTGEQFGYDRLVIATGSRPFVPPIPGIKRPGVFVYRTVEDLESIRNYSRNVRSAAVLGGGLLGLEAAKALHNLGLETHVLEMAPALMPRQLDAEGASVLQSEIEQLGVHVHLLKRTQAIEADGTDRILSFDRGPDLRVGMVVCSAGIRPRDDIAHICGLKTGPRGGIVVNDRLETSDPRIFAIGECAVHRDTVYGLVAPGYQMADVLAENLCGGDATFEHGDQSAKLKLLGVDVTTLGEPLGETPGATTLTSQIDDCYRKLILERGRVVGAMSVGPWPEIDRVRQAITAGRRLRGWNLSRFQKSGRLWAERATQRVADWPEQAPVCSCLGVTRGVLSRAQREGCATVEDLVDATRASTVCGSCKPLLAELVGAPAETRARWKGLLAASIAATCLILTWFILGPLPFSESVVNFWHQVDVIWRDSFWRQVTGYTLLGISTIGLLLPLRKRWKRFSFGDFGHWRSVHGAVGVLTLVGMAIHTGFHLGSNLNFLLAITFLGLNSVGAMTAAITAWECRATGPTAMLLKRWRPRVTRLHILFLWPLPVLLVYHIACVYYF